MNCWGLESSVWPFDFWMLTKFILIFFIKPDECKSLNIIISGYVNNIIIKI